MLKKVSLILAGIVTATAAYAGAAMILINGAGASFPYPIYTKWFDVYQQSHAGVQFNYQSIGCLLYTSPSPRD